MNSSWKVFKSTINQSLNTIKLLPSNIASLSFVLDNFEPILIFRAHIPWASNDLKDPIVSPRHFPCHRND